MSDMDDSNIVSDLDAEINSGSENESILDSDTDTQSYESENESDSEEENSVIQSIRKKYFKKKNVVVSSHKDQDISDNEGDVQSSNVTIESNESEDKDLNVTDESVKNAASSKANVNSSSGESSLLNLTSHADEDSMIQNIKKKNFKKRNFISSSDEEDLDVLDNDEDAANSSNKNMRHNESKDSEFNITDPGPSSHINSPSSMIGFNFNVVSPKRRSIRNNSDNNSKTSSSEDASKHSSDNADDNDHDDDIDKRMLSPRTRLSITGIRNSDLSDNSDISDIDSKNQNDIHSSESESDNNFVNSDNEAIVIGDSDDSDERISIEKRDVMYDTKQLSNKFEDTNISLVENGAKKSLSMSDLNDSKFNLSHDNILKSSTPSGLKTSRQNKIHTEAVIYVSEEEHNKALLKLQKLESDLAASNRVVEHLKHTLPDNGRRVSGHIKQLEYEITKQIGYISRLQVRKTAPKLVKDPIKDPDIEIISWDDLNAGVCEVQPKYTGKVGLKNFNIQKGLTTEALQNIHGSLETCPNESVLSMDPEGLKVPLMEHQKYALSWMEWREKQRPRGGILADDMGLGKTLTCIAYILSSFSREENSEPDSDDASDSGWIAKGRRDYYNGGTLVVCPASLLGQWEQEIKNRVGRNLIKYEVYHGTKRDKNAKKLGRNDIVITTYNIVSRENSNNDPLFKIKWKRIILDEGHIIRNAKSLVSQSACNLNGIHRWILTGTPIHNKEDDVFALFKFLKCKPFDDLTQFKRWIANKTTGGSHRLNTIMKVLMLRRMKNQLIAKGSIIDIPSKEIKLVQVNLDKEEMNVYQKILMYSRTLFAQYLHQRVEKTADQFISGGGMSTNKKSLDVYYKAHQRFAQSHGSKEVKSHEILVLLLRLRQICCHPGLITAMLEDNDRSSLLETSSEADDSEIDLLDQINKLKISEEEEGEHSVKMKSSGFVLKSSNPVFDYTRASSKIRTVLDIIEMEILTKNEKAVIVSQWAKVLELVGQHLRLRGIKSTTLDGSVAVKLRGDIVSTFNSSNNNTKVLLLSLTAGGVGLNLTGANHLLLIDLHWNPQLESQAQDRIYRVGQTKPVIIYKLVCAETIEDRIKLLQEKKLQIANDVLSGAKTKGSKLTLDDLKSLFEL